MNDRLSIHPYFLKISCLAAALLLITVSAFRFEAYASDKPVTHVRLAAPEHAWWRTDTQAQWSAVHKQAEVNEQGYIVPGADWKSVSQTVEYQVKLYLADDVELEYDEDAKKWNYEASEDGLSCVTSVHTTDTSYDFSDYMKDLHSYFYVVRAIPKMSQIAYVENGAWTISPEVDFRQKQTMGITEGKWRNYMEGSRYDLGDGQGFLEEGWQLIRGKWYYLSGGGYRQTGWIMPEPDQYYYLYEDGVMACSTVIDGWRLDSTGLRQEHVQE